ncbi:MAG: TolC family protein [Candidatus Cloacimonetes bacterium]|nr:TolC family protein [Candidatus Cloacimonadota bacterium]
MKRKLKYLIFCFFITVAFHLQASEGSPPKGIPTYRDTSGRKEYSLPELVSIYLQKSYGQRIRAERLQRQKLILENRKATFYPNLSTNFQLPGHYHSKQDFSLNNSNINEYNYLQSNIVLQEILPWNSELSFSKSFTANLYKDGRYYSSTNNIGFKYYLFKKNVPKLNYQYSKLQYEELSYQQKESLNSDIIELANLYYQTVLQKIRVVINQNNLERNQKLLQMAEIKYKSGVIDILTKNQIELRTREVDFALKKQKQELQYYLQQLADKLGIANIEDVDIDFRLLFFIEEDLNLTNNSEILRLQTQLKSTEINYELTSAQFDWHFILGGEYNWGGRGAYLEEFGSSIGTDNYTAYLGIELPLYDGRINRLKLAQRRTEKKELEYQLLQRTDELKSRWNYLFNKIRLIEGELELLNDNVKLAKDNLEIATDKLLRGEISYSDWSQIEASYEQTELNLLNQNILLNQCILENYKIIGKNLVEEIVN